MSNRTYTDAQLRAVMARFQVFGDLRTVVPYGSGHINDTFKADLSLGGAPVSYILQRINSEIFTRPDKVMETISRVTGHIRAKLAGDPDASRQTLTVVPAREGLPYARDDEGNWWRLYVFIAGAKTYDVITSPDQAYKAANAFGRFQDVLAALDAAAGADTCGRRAKVADELAFVDARRESAGRLLARNKAGEIPERI